MENMKNKNFIRVLYDFNQSINQLKIKCSSMVSSPRGSRLQYLLLVLACGFCSWFSPAVFARGSRLRFPLVKIHLRRWWFSLFHSRSQISQFSERGVWGSVTNPISMVGLCGPEHKPKPTLVAWWRISYAPSWWSISYAPYLNTCRAILLLGSSSLFFRANIL